MSQAFHGDPHPVHVKGPMTRAPGLERRSSDAINRLGRQFDAVCTRAVDPMQIAAALEADGHTDATTRSRYGVASVFELAQLLFELVPLRDRASADKPMSLRLPWRELSHGLMFALPAAYYPVLVSQVGPSLAAVAITVAVVVGWSWSQFIVRVSYTLRGSGSAASAVKWLRFSSLGGVLLAGAAAAAVAWQNDWPLPLVAVAAGQMAYHMAAALLIHYRLEGRLLLTLAPGVAAGGAYLMVPQALPMWLVIGIIALSLAGAWAVALGVRTTAGGPAGLRRAPTLRELSEAAPFLLYGLACALLVSYDSLRYRDWIGSTRFGLTLAPLVLSMGILEWQLRAFRERVAASLGVSTSSRDLARRMWSHFVASLTIFAALLGLLSAGSYLLVFRGGEDLGYLSSTLLANWVLGCAFFVGFALISQNRIALVARCATVALVVHLFDLTRNLTFATPGAKEASSYLIACLILLFVQLLVARKVLFEVRNYSYDVHLRRQARVQRLNDPVRRAS